VEYVVIPLTALFVSSLTLFSGFGLGTVLMPAFAIFFPVPVAVAATAVVHLANNVFKVALVGHDADWGVVVHFALTAALAAVAGAWLLGRLSFMPDVASYHVGGWTFEMTLVKVVVGVLVLAFALFDLMPGLRKLSFERRYLPLGGVLSGFFGGLSGHQGAMRSAFLIKSGLDARAFVGTGAVCAFVVDLVRLAVYSAAFYVEGFAPVRGEAWRLVLLGVLAAFIGSFAGARLLRKVTLRALQYIVGAMLMLAGIGLVAGLI
jgi:hypothetical protein